MDNNKNRIPKYVNKDIIKQIRSRNKLWSRYKDNPDFSKLAKYKSIRNDITSNIRTARRKFERNLAKNIKDGTKAFYAYVNDKRVARDKIGPLKDDLGNMVTHNREMGRILKGFFSSVFTIEDLETIPAVSEEHYEVKMEEVRVTENRVRKVIMQTKKNKAAGVDDINSNM